MLGYGVTNILNGKCGKLKLVAVRVNELAISCITVSDWNFQKADLNTLPFNFVSTEATRPSSLVAT